ncbi:RNA polymerase sigma factor [Thiofilum flexile]|uniref:RNA polymerase sigma factor n=1 Tax=Thiofilum flexile TaxID=125627 RepID=UPI00037DC740|nr:RNA polymerase sigma factor [Thiofilum flexile]
MKSAESQVAVRGHAESEEQGNATSVRAIKMNQFLQGVEKKAFIVARWATKDADEALDIVQEAMLKLVQRYLERSEAEWGPLFHTILQSKINDWHRRQYVRNRWRVFFHNDPEDDLDPEDLVVQEVFLEPEHQLMVEELNGRLLQVIGQLPPRQRQAIVLRAWEGYDIAQTATIMKCSESSVKTHYSRAIHHLREKLEDLS